jgi:hypothetical protein
MNQIANCRVEPYIQLSDADKLLIGADKLIIAWGRAPRVDAFKNYPPADLSGAELMCKEKKHTPVWADYLRVPGGDGLYALLNESLQQKATKMVKAAKIAILALSEASAVTATTSTKSDIDTKWTDAKPAVLRLEGHTQPGLVLLVDVLSHIFSLRAALTIASAANPFSKAAAAKTALTSLTMGLGTCIAQLTKRVHDVAWGSPCFMQ